MIGKTAVAARLLRYTEKEKAGGTEPRVLYSEGLRCRVPTAEREFAAVRRMHGKQGAQRKVPAKYELPEPGEVATHVRRARPNGRKYWGVAAGSTAATHVRHEGDGYVDELQAVHVIVSFGLDEVNPDDPEQVRGAFDFVATMMSELYPGVQMKLVCQADGVGNAFHVHVVQNAVIVEQMAVDGQVWEAGRKMSGALTNIDRVRERTDEFIAQHGAEYGVEQKLPPVTKQKAEKRKTRDRRMAAKGDISNHDIIRAAFEDSMDDPRSVHLDGFVEVMAERYVTVNHRVARSGKPGETNTLSYRLDVMKTPVRGTTLGDHFAFESAVSQLDANVSGKDREGRPEQRRTGPPKPCFVPTTQELVDAQSVVARLAQEEHLAQVEQYAVRARDQANANFFPAVIEDFEAATDADRIGDFLTLARLADATRAKEARQKTQGATFSASPGATSERRPVQAPELPRPEKSFQRFEQTSPIKEEAMAEARGIELQKAIQAPAQPTVSPVPGSVSLSALRDAQGSTAVPRTAPPPPAHAEVEVVNDRENEDEAEKLRRINERNRRLGLPAVSQQQYSAKNAMTPAQRARLLKQPDLVDDIEPATGPRPQESALGD